jgi:hypothetical protein
VNAAGGDGVETEDVERLDHHVLPAVGLAPVALRAVERMRLELVEVQGTSCLRVLTGFTRNRPVRGVSSRPPASTVLVNEQHLRVVADDAVVVHHHSCAVRIAQ